MLVALIIVVLYTFLIGSFIYGFDKIEVFNLNKGLTPKTTFTIIIPFKNEALTLKTLLQSISEIDYPKHLFEVILVNDASTDNSVKIVAPFLTKNINVINTTRATKSPKKDAITTAITIAKHQWIVTTDADCTVPKLWLKTLDSFIQKTNTLFIAAPVTYNTHGSFLDRFQTLDILSLMGATIGAFGLKKPILCNGANLIYTKVFFNTINGFSGNSHIASGDDIFMLQKALQYAPEKTHYLKSKTAIVTTVTQPNCKQLLSQRVRWASKASKVNNWFNSYTSLIVLLGNLNVIICFVLMLLQYFNWKLFFFIFVIKCTVDVILIRKSAFFFKQKNILKSYAVSSILYPWFCTYVALKSLVSGYNWKGKTYK